MYISTKPCHFTNMTTFLQNTWIKCIIAYPTRWAQQTSSCQDLWNCSILPQPPFIVSVRYSYSFRIFI